MRHLARAVYPEIAAGQDGRGRGLTINGDACAAPGECLSASCADGVCCNTACAALCQACNSSGSVGTCSNIASGQDPANECSGATTCNGAGACTTLSNGSACSTNGQCASGWCVDGVCCNAACNGTCQACNSYGSTGTCTAVPSGTDPGNECTGNGGTDVCNGAGACKEINGMPCSSGGECLSTLCVDGVCCNSTCSSTCQACNLAASLGACTNVPNGQDPASECAGVTSCNGSGACTKLSNGSTCTLNGECSSNYCVDGMCCNTSCTGTCQACAGAKTGGTNGTCAYITAATDPDNECPNNGANDVCNGAGACKEINGTPCFASSECLTGYCADGFCCNTSCGGACQACSAAKSGGTSGACGNITAATDPDNECAGVTTCNGAGTCTKLSTGSACTLNGECSSGYCVDGVCCGTSCTGTCMACSAAKTGGANGTCAAVLANTDPDGECLAGECNGAGACELPAGMACTQGSQCISGTCLSGVCGCVVEVTAGHNHTCARKADNSVLCWGLNENGQAGSGTTMSPKPTPAGVINLFGSNVEIAAGGYHTCVRKTNSYVWCWGANGTGQVGNGGVTNSELTPAVVYSGPAVEIAAGGYHTCIRRVDGVVWCWGANGTGQVGIEDPDGSQPWPVQVENLANAVEIAAGWVHTCARKNDGTVWCWGYNGDGQVGDGTTNDRHTPVQVLLGMSAVEITAGGYHTCARMVDGSVSCWGKNDSGQLGNEMPASIQSTPVTVTDLGTSAVEITAGGHHTCARKTDGSVWCWGYNLFGQVGTGNTNSPQLKPFHIVAFGTSAVDIEAGYNHTCAHDSDGSLRCLGYNYYGQVGDGSAAPGPGWIKLSPVMAGVTCP